MYRTFAFILIISFICQCYASSNTTLESMKKGVQPINVLGNKFFEIALGESSFFENMKTAVLEGDITSPSYIFKQMGDHIVFSIFICFGICFILLMPLSGLIVFICRCCCRKCGGKIPVMDPPHAKIKLIIYQLIMSILTCVMLFGTILALINNQIVYEELTSKDPSINLPQLLKSNSNQMDVVLTKLKEEIKDANPNKVEIKDTDQFVHSLLLKALETLKAICKEDVFQKWLVSSKSLKQNISAIGIAEHLRFSDNINDELNNYNTELNNIKSKINGKLAKCTSDNCRMLRQDTDKLGINSIDSKYIKQFNKSYKYIDSSSEFVAFLKEMIQIMTSGELNNHQKIDIKFKIEKAIEKFTQELEKGNYTKQIKDGLMAFIDKVMIVNGKFREYIPVASENSRSQANHTVFILRNETFRYYGYLALGLVLVLIVIFYLLGLIYGLLGGRPNGETGCCNKGIGANFLMSGVTFAFLFGWLAMLVVIISMMSFGTLQTDFCRYMDRTVEKGPAKLDQYIDIVLNLMDNSNYTGLKIAQNLLTVSDKHSNNIYTSFGPVVNRVIQGEIQGKVGEIDEPIIQFISTIFNSSGKLKDFPDYIKLEPSLVKELINMKVTDDEFDQYILKLQSQPDMSKEVEELGKINRGIKQRQATLMKIFLELRGLYNVYQAWLQPTIAIRNDIPKFVEKFSPGIKQLINEHVLRIINNAFVKMFVTISTLDLRLNIYQTFDLVCDHALDFVNGIWYGLGIFVLLLIPSIVFALLLVSLYRRLEKYYPDRPEPDYGNYIGFYARTDPAETKKSIDSKAPVHRGYRPIPMQQMA